MATAVRVTRGLTPNTTFGRDLERQILDVIEKDAERVRLMTLERVKAIVGREFKTSHTGRTRGPALIDSFTCTVRRDSGPYPVVITLRSSAAAVKVNTLNNGSIEHDIGGEGKRMTFVPKGGGDPLTREGPFKHKGQPASWFMQRAIEQAVSAVYRKTVRLPRR